MANLIFDNQDAARAARSISGVPPSHYTVKIMSFSLLAKNSVERYDSGNFEAGGYTWKLVLYPNGNTNKNVKDNISLYLSIAETSGLRPGWEVYAVFRLFLLDQNTDSYLTLEDATGKGRRFHGVKLEWGFDEFIPLKAFNDVSNGYLVDDACVFGAEVFVCKEKCTGKGECLTMIKEPPSYKQSWRIENFSKLATECYDSNIFYAGDQTWKIKLYPKGKGNGAGTHLSLYLALVDAPTLPPGFKIYADFTLRMLDQMYAKDYFSKAKARYWFTASSLECGWSRYVSLSVFNYQNSGLLFKDTCLVEAEVTVLGVVNALS